LDFGVVDGLAQRGQFVDARGEARQGNVVGCGDKGCEEECVESGPQRQAVHGGGGGNASTAVVRVKSGVGDSRRQWASGRRKAGRGEARVVRRRLCRAVQRRGAVMGYNADSEDSQSATTANDKRQEERMA
jgi:hypothetical protein